MLEYKSENAEPVLAPIKSGWAALGDGWAVHGRTREEAVRKYEEAKQRHRDIDARPLWYERQDVQVYESYCA